MLIYEKENKLNISFENNLQTPDIEIGKSEINVDGNNIVSGGITFVHIDNQGKLDKTYNEIKEAMNTSICIVNGQFSNGFGQQWISTLEHDSNSDLYFVTMMFANGLNTPSVNTNMFVCSSPDEYPHFYSASS